MSSARFLFLSMLILLLSYFTNSSPAQKRTTLHQISHQTNGSILDAGKALKTNESSNQEDFLQRLLQKVLGIEPASRRKRHPRPPQYMLDLYNSVAGTSGLTHTPNPYHANVVRSYLDRDPNHGLQFYFNISSNMNPKTDRVLEAEFHLYKLKPRLRAKSKATLLKSQLLEVRVYQVMHKGKKKKKKGDKLLDSRRLSVQSKGWEVFYVRLAVEDWMSDTNSNMGLLVTVRSTENEELPNGLVRFVKRHHHYPNRQPLLVLFVDDGRNANRKYYPQTSDYHTYGYKVNQTLPEEMLESADTQSSSRMQRAVGNSIKDNGGHRQSCTKHDLYVDFENIGWSAWIISPKGYNAYYCKGDCAFPLGQNQLPTNHATVQSIVHELKLTQGVGTPCCVPNKLYSISLLYFDEHENVILKQYDDMVASRCGCQ